MTAHRGSQVTPATRTVPERRGWLILFSVLVGIGIAILWSAKFVDGTIGENIADTVLGYDAKGTSIVGELAGVSFAFVAGLAGTFTACNVAAFSALAPMLEDDASTGSRVRQALRPLFWVSVGMVPVAAAYGAIGALLGDRLPQLSTAVTSGGLPVRLLQSVVVFVVVGLAFAYLGLAALGVVPDPLARLTARRPHTPEVVLGILIGAFLIGRPYPLFRKMFVYAADVHNPLYGALTFVLVSVGNIVIMAALFLLLAVGTGGRFQRWLTAKPGRAARITGAALLIGGVFTFVYWGVRLPAKFGYGWFPMMPWT